MPKIDRLLRRALYAACAAMFAPGLATPAAAAGLSAPADTATDWSGFYVGGQIGGAWSESDWRYKNYNWFNTFGPLLLGTQFDFDGSGVIGGGQAGFNYQSGAWVFGVEGSLAGADLDDDYPGPWWPTDRYATQIGLLATVTGRLGYAQDRWLFYGKAGWAGADVELTLNDTVDGIRARSNEWANGWTAGAGAEYAFGRNLSLAVEYSYADLGTGSFTTRCNCPGGIGGGTPVVDANTEIQSVTARLNYRFGK